MPRKNRGIRESILVERYGSPQHMLVNLISSNRFNMKTILLFLFFSFFMYDHEVADRETHKHNPCSEKIKGDIDFKTQIQPILQKRCSPCHFPGGKMYERLPFDTASSIFLKKEMILKRIKDEPDNKLISEFIQQNENK